LWEFTVVVKVTRDHFLCSCDWSKDRTALMAKFYMRID
jgi:hypothetical protein